MQLATQKPVTNSPQVVTLRDSASWPGFCLFHCRKHMKTRANLERTLIALLGVTICFAGAVSAAERYNKPVSTNNQRTGSVVGQLTTTFCKRVVAGEGESVTLTPLSGGQPITTKTDADGRFVFQNVPPGQYGVRTKFEWTTTFLETYDDGIQDWQYADHSRDIVGQVQVKSGQAAHIKNYTVSPTHDAFYSYGGSLSRPHHPLVTCE